MVLITGTNLRVEDLPNNDVVDYIIENKKMALKLKTVAKKPECIQIYIIESQRTEYTITDEIAGKIQYFNNDEELINLLKFGTAHKSVDIFDENYGKETISKKDENEKVKDASDVLVLENETNVDKNNSGIAMIIPDKVEKAKDVLVIDNKKQEEDEDNQNVMVINEKQENDNCLKEEVDIPKLELDMNSFDDLGDRTEVKSSDYTTSDIDFGVVSNDLSFVRVDKDNNEKVLSIDDKANIKFEEKEKSSLEKVDFVEEQSIEKEENKLDVYVDNTNENKSDDKLDVKNLDLPVEEKVQESEKSEVGLFIDVDESKGTFESSNDYSDGLDTKVEESENGQKDRRKITVEGPDIFKDNREFIDSTPDVDIHAILGDMQIKEVDTFLPDSMLSIPNIDEDTDATYELLLKKDKVIAQKDKIINELNRNIESAYKSQEVQIAEIQELYNQKLTEAQNIIDTLQNKLQNVSFTDEMTDFLKLINFAKNYKGCVPEGFNLELQQKIGGLSSKYFIFCTSGGDSLHTMLKQIKKLIEKSCNCIIYDFTNDNFLASSYRIDMKKSSTTMDLLKDEQKPTLKQINNTYFLPTTNYNDIALLNANWVEVIKRIDEISCGKQVILLFGNINNFAVRYTVSQLSAIGKLFLCAKCSPVILSTMFSDLQFMPIKNLMIVALEYIDIVKTILEGISRRYNVYATAKDIEWGSKIGLKR